MLNLIHEIFQYSFLVRAFISGLLVSTCASLLGVSLVLKRFSMIGDGLSHLSFGALAIALAIGLAPYSVAIPVVLIASFFLLRLSQNSRIKSDSALAIISSSSLAIGVIAVSLGEGVSTDVYNYMFGSILTSSKEDIQLIALLTIIVCAFYLIFNKKIFALTFDENFAAASGIRVGIYNSLLAALTSFTIVMGMRIMGALLVSALIIFPPLSAMRLFKSYKRVTVMSVIFSLIAFVTGFFTSYAYSLPSGASIVIANLAIFLITMTISKFRVLQHISRI